MDEAQVSIDMPTDADGFFRRKCQACGREFKWFDGQTASAPDDWQDPEDYYCPYCGHQAPSDEWLTDDQRRYVEQIALVHVEDLVRDELDGIVRSVNRRSGPIRMKMSGGPSSSPPSPLSEPNDMEPIASPCHPFEPIKIVDDTDRYFCLICGSSFTLQ